ncbi:immunoglobulin superfamily member 1-like [Elgaria multicarinata webbii]|uniref:immunoglobulin superfamily member 1-like n=1 Tax=Elgaria multicarinata webbii TaxID=159646 RepID=UPI002FCCBECC
MHCFAWNNIEIDKDLPFLLLCYCATNGFISFPGWWLTGQWWTSRGQSYPNPSISVIPSGMVALGGNVTIHCKMKKYSDGMFYFNKKQPNWKTIHQEKTASDEAVFSIVNASQLDGGIYSCRYCNNYRVCSDFRKETYINITDTSLSKPSIKMILRGQSTPGENVTIVCKGPEKDLIFALHKSGEQIASRAAEPERDTAEFPFSMVSLEDAETYTCQYCRRRNPFVWSKPSDSLELGEFSGSITTIWAYISAAGLLLLLVLLLFAFVLYRKRRKGSLASEEDQPVSVPLEPDAGEDPDDPDGVSYAELNHQPTKTKQAVNPGIVPDSCVYASRDDEEQSSLPQQSRVPRSPEQAQPSRGVHRSKKKRSRASLGSPQAERHGARPSPPRAYAGWWLTMQWQTCRGNIYHKPSISVSPGQVLTLFGNATIHCKAEKYPHKAEFSLYAAGASSTHNVAFKKAEEGEAVFSIVKARQLDAGKYWCRYCFNQNTTRWCSYLSDEVYINITDPSLPKPSINVRPRDQLVLGKDMMIECQGPENDLNFFLHKSKALIASQMTEKDTTEFLFSAAKLEDAGNYSCQYHRRENPFVWSEPSDPIELVLSDAATQDVEIFICLAAAGVVLLALVLVVTEAVYSWRK